MEFDQSIVSEIMAIDADQALAYDAIAMQIWEHPEVSFEEEKSAALYMERLESRGFVITEFPEMAHSFMAEFGAGDPVIGYMGEYDALPGMSQACTTHQEPIIQGAPGHACGHNLLGMGSLVAAEVLATLVKAKSCRGRVRFYGCPAEEALGRIPLVKAGRFSDADAIMTWHPADVNTPHRYTTSANLALIFSFRGRASHAGMAPQNGRSALDAVQLFNLSLEFMREHLSPGIMLHYVISDGGQRPNIVPESAATFLYIRAPSAQQIHEVSRRVLKAAQGAALMTETKFSTEIRHGKCDFVPNNSIQDSLLNAMQSIPFPRPTKEEMRFARELQHTVPKTDRSSTLDPIGAPHELLKHPLHTSIGDFGRGKRIGGSLDTGDVSYVTPTGQINAATWPVGIGNHTWQSCASSGSSWAQKAAQWAGMCMAFVGFELVSDEEYTLLKAAKEEHKRAGLHYRSTMEL